MSQAFKRRFDQLLDNDPTRQESAKVDGMGESTVDSLAHQFYETAGHARNLCLVWPDGRRMMLNYTYLVSGELTVSEDSNEILLLFSMQTIRLKGYGLESLFMSLMDHLPRMLVMTDERYVATAETKEGLIVAIILENK